MAADMWGPLEMCLSGASTGGSDGGGGGFDCWQSGSDGDSDFGDMDFACLGVELPSSE